jgi:pimeloyl-ACP methyl ester carboxylesterase
VKNLRTYGQKPYRVAVVHGGPGAPGGMAPVARELATICGVLEPLQTKDTLQGQVRELTDVVKANGDLPVILAGWSWGAWLAFIVAARHPALVKKLILIGSAAFAERYAVNIVGDRLDRLTEAARVEALSLSERLNEPSTPAKNRLMARLGALFAKADAYMPLRHESEILEYDFNINKKVWAAAHALRVSGRLLKLGGKIRCPVVAIHGDYDTHLAEGVREPLGRVLKDFKFILLEKCGHEPWLERFAREKFYALLKSEL